MRLAFVVQRYGLDVHGGAETECREWAERLARHHHVEVLTTCARDFLTWADFYLSGAEMINGVRVWRFPVDAPRDLESFNAFSQTIIGQPHTEAQEIEWMRRQGPYSSGLFAAIEARCDDFDLFVFVTYLYCSTFFGMPLVRDKAVLAPTAHDEFAIYLGIFERVFRQARYLIYNTATEALLLRRLFPAIPFRGKEVGLGVDVSALSEPAPASPALLLYIGRVHTSKGCEQLCEYVLRYKRERNSPLRLAFAGRADIALPEHPDVLHLGYVDEERKRQLLSEASLLVMPSSFESLSIVCLEAWAAGVPTLVNGASEVLREQTLRSQGGLFYTSYDEFAACLDLLLEDQALRRRLGRQGRAFVERWYSWSVVEQRLEIAVAEALEIVKERSETQNADETSSTLALPS